MSTAIREIPNTHAREFECSCGSVFRFGHGVSATAIAALLDAHICDKIDGGTGMKLPSDDAVLEAVAALLTENYMGPLLLGLDADEVADRLRKIARQGVERW